MRRLPLKDVVDDNNIVDEVGDCDTNNVMMKASLIISEKLKDTEHQDRPGK